VSWGDSRPRPAVPLMGRTLRDGATGGAVVTKSPSQYGSQRKALLDEARSILAEHSAGAARTDSQLEHYLLEDIPAEVPLELRLRFRDLEVAEAFRALRLARES
jgi:hypothetical protein